MMRKILINVVAPLAMLMPLVSSATVINANGVSTINLLTPNRQSVPHTVTYHAGFDQYYGADSGSTNRRAWVWDASGNVVQDFAPPIGVDTRGLNYNPNTNAIEVVTFSAQSGDGGNVQGLMTMGLDATGLYTGTNTNTLASLPGLAGTQTTPSYDPTADVLYSRSSGANTNVVRRSDGTLLSTIALDLAAAGNPNLQSGFLGYDEIENVLIALAADTAEAVVFDLTGSYLGSSQLSGLNTVNANGNTGYTNGQIFIFDSSLGNNGGYRGFDIFADNAVPAPATLALLSLGMIGIASRRRRQTKSA